MIRIIQIICINLLLHNVRRLLFGYLKTENSSLWKAKTPSVDMKLDKSAQCAGKAVTHKAVTQKAFLTRQ